MGKGCDLKTSSQAWNDGIEAFKKAFLSSGGKTTESIRFALNEMQMKHPDLDFEVSSFTEPLTKELKAKGVIDQKYSYKEKVKPAKTEAEKLQKKVDKIAEGMKGLNDEQKKEFAKKVFEKLNEEGLLSNEQVKNLYSEAIGLPAMDKQMKELVSEVAKNNKALAEKNKEIKTLFGEAQTEKAEAEGVLPEESDVKYQAKLKELQKERDELDDKARASSEKLAERLQEKGFWLKDFTDMMRLNLMSPVSLLKNTTGALLDAGSRYAASTANSAMSQILRLVPGLKNTHPLLAKTKGTFRAEPLTAFKKAWQYGSDGSYGLPKTSSVDSVRHFRMAAEMKGWDSIKNYVAGTFKVLPNMIGKTLGATDAMFHEMSQKAELNRIAEEKGLKGVEKEAFLENPDEKSAEMAKKYADKVTFRTELPFNIPSNFNYEGAVKKMVDGGMNPLAAKYAAGAAYMGTTLLMPFVKTPVNIVRGAFGLMSPEIAIGQAIFDSYSTKDNATEKQRILTEGVGKAIVGAHIRGVALSMIAQGLISAGYSDEDKKTKDVIEQKAGGPNRINYNALIRGLMFMDTKEQKGDRYVDLNALGILGIALGSYAHAFNKMSKEDLEKEKEFNLKNEFSVVGKTLRGSLGATLDYTFFTGINEVMKAAKDEGGFEMDKYTINQMMSILGGIVPSTLQKLSTQKDPLVYKQYDKDKGFGENLANALGYRFAGQTGTMEKKYFSLAEDPQKGGVKKKEYMLFDNYFGRVLQSELGVFKSTEADVDTPISRLYDATRDVEKDDRDALFPSAINKEVSLGKGKRAVKVALTPEQHGYLQDRASVHRMLLSTPYIVSEDFKKDSHDVKTEALSSFYNSGLENAKAELMEKFPDIKSQKIEGGSGETKKEAKSRVKKYKKKD